MSKHDVLIFIFGFFSFPVALFGVLIWINICQDRNNGCDADGP